MNFDRKNVSDICFPYLFASYLIFEHFKTMKRYYTRGEIVPFEEDLYHEFKGHRTISIENRMPDFTTGEFIKTRQQWSKYLCGMLNSGQRWKQDIRENLNKDRKSLLNVKISGSCIKATPTYIIVLHLLDT